MHLKDLCRTLKLRKRENTFDNTIANFAIWEYNTPRTYVCILITYGSAKKCVVAVRTSALNGKATALTERSTVNSNLRGDIIPFPLNQNHYFVGGAKMQEIQFYCRRCKKSLRISYILTGDDNAPVLPNVQIICNQKTCRRAMYLKNYTEKQLIENSVDGKFYM